MTRTGTRPPRSPQHGDDDVEWFFPYHWTAVDPFAWPSSRRPADIGHDELDRDLVRVVYGVAVEQIPCGVCGAALDPAIDVRQRHGAFAAPRILAATHCQGSGRHRHVAKVRERAGELRLGYLRPA